MYTYRIVETFLLNNSEANDSESLENPWRTILSYDMCIMILQSNHPCLQLKSQSLGHSTCPIIKYIEKVYRKRFSRNSEA